MLECPNGFSGKRRRKINSWKTVRSFRRPCYQHEKITVWIVKWDHLAKISLKIAAYPKKRDLNETVTHGIKSLNTKIWFFKPSVFQSSNHRNLQIIMKWDYRTNSFLAHSMASSDFVLCYQLMLFFFILLFDRYF